MKNLSTRRLKRYYWKYVKQVWHWDKHRDGDWANGPAGVARVVAQKSMCQGRAIAAKAELEHRGLWMP